MTASNLAVRAQATTEAVQALADISEQYGHISPELVVNDAERDDSPLHGYFIWDDAIAGNRYRLNQARFLIRTVKLDIVRRGADKREISVETTRAYVSPPAIRGEESYIKLADAMNDEALREGMLERAKRELKALKSRYQQLSELANVWDAVELI